MRSPLAAFGALALAALVACGGYGSSSPYGSSGGGSGGPIGSVSVGLSGRIAFTSAHNGTANPAVDTVTAGGTVSWTWSGNQGISHSVQSIGSSTFASSSILSGDGQTYTVTFPTPGTYQYDCAVHGRAMTGTVVVR